MISKPGYLHKPEGQFSKQVKRLRKIYLLVFVSSCAPRKSECQHYHLETVPNGDSEILH